MKGKILAVLRTEDRPVSGERLSAGLGISRVSVWKHVKKLETLGYAIVSSPKGYQLKASPDVPFPWEFPQRQSRMHYVAETGSTMDNARVLARKGCPHFTVVVAGRQTTGRGRLNRTWQSDAGGLYFTVVLRPVIPPQLSPMVNFVTSTVLVRTLRQMYAIDAGVKWPNDIMVGGKKLSGMLSELDTRADMVAFVNIGLGINVNNDVAAVRPPAVSLKKILGHRVSASHFLARFLDHLEARLRAVNYEQVIAEWKRYTVTLHRRVRIVTHHGQFEGLAVDVDETGALVLALSDGSLQKVIYGDCFDTGPPGV